MQMSTYPTQDVLCRVASVTVDERQESEEEEIAPVIDQANLVESIQSEVNLNDTICQLYRCR